MSPKPELLSPEYRYWDLLWQYVGISWDDAGFIEKENQLFKLFNASDKLKDVRKGIWDEMKKEGKKESQKNKFPSSSFNGINLMILLDTINKRIEKLLDKDHQIGHSYFISVMSFSDLKHAFQNKIIPLLQEYFFGDYGKIGLVLGEGFFDLNNAPENIIFASFNDYDGSEYAERKTYKLKNISQLSDENFIDAINLLLK